MTQFLDNVYHFGKQFLDAHNQHYPVSSAEYIDSMPSQKQKLYRAREQTAMQTRIDDKNSFKVKANIKAEKKPVKVDFIARIFGAYDIVVNILTGRFLKPLEHGIFHGINRTFQNLTGGHEFTVLKGMNAEEKARVIAEKWAMFGEPLAIELDCTHFDKHINSTLLRSEHSLYYRFYHGAQRRELKRLLSYQIDVDWEARSDDGYKLNYSTRGGRVSGCVNTAMGNISVMCQVFYTYAHLLSQMGIKFEYVNEGDDCFFIIEKRYRPLLPNIFDHFIRFGLQVRIENEVTDIHKISFCQTSPMFINGRWVMIRPPKTVFFKDLCQIQYLNLETYQKWMHEVGVGGSILNAGVPVFSVFYMKLVEWGSKNGELPNALKNDMAYSGLWSLIKNMSVVSNEITSQNRFEFFLATGITSEMQILLETKFANANLLTDVMLVLEDPVFELVI